MSGPARAFSATVFPVALGAAVLWALALMGGGLEPLLGCGPQVISLFVLVSAVHGLFQHSNLQLRLGPLNGFFSMAELHRWHHSRVTREESR